MDKLKIVLAVLKRQHFWVLCALVLLVLLPLWWMGTGAVAERFTAGKTRIEGRFGGMTTIVGTHNHANQKCIDAVEKGTTALKKKVLEAWTKCYDEQKEKNQLPENLSGDFADSFWSGNPIDIDNRQRYWRFIPAHVTKFIEEELNVRRPKLQPGEDAEPEGTRRPRGNATDNPGRTRNQNRSGSGATTPGDEMIGAVEWEVGREEIESLFKWEVRPSTQQIRDAQQDLWVIEALVRIITKLNAGATSNHNATIRRIDALEIGRPAVKAWKDSAQSVIRLGKSEDSSSAKSQEESEEARYVDDDGNLLAPGASPPYAEFNMMPIRMRLVMNQTKIPDLLVACAESDMPVEVRAVRIQPGKGTTLNSSELAGASGGGAGGKTGPASGVKLEALNAQPATSLYIPVEIQGIICIYNPPDEDKLGTGAAGEQPTGTPTTDAPAPSGPQPAPVDQPPAPETPAAETGPGSPTGAQP